MEYLGYLASIFIGVSIGLVGAGGSILAMPILVYLFGISPELATSYSLFIVGSTSLLGTFRQYKFGNLDIQSALYFAASSVLSLLIIRKFILPIIPDSISLNEYFIVDKRILLMLVFALLMIAASMSMIRGNVIESDDAGNNNKFRILALGLGVGCVTGFLGAGGGFLIIPSLVVFSGLPIKKAVGTSLFIVFLNSAIGFGGDLVNGVRIDYQLLLSISAVSIIGMFVGTLMSQKISGAKLKPLFGWFILVMGVFIIAKELLLK